MKAKQTIHKLTGSITACALILSLWSFESMAQASSHQAVKKSAWWFDIEVLIYNRLDNKNPSPELFSSEPKDYSHANGVDLLTPYLQPNLSRLAQNLSFCLPKPHFRTPLNIGSAIPPLEWEEEAKQLAQLLKSVAQQQAEEFIQQTNQWDIAELSVQNCATQEHVQAHWFTPPMQTHSMLEIEHVPQVIDGVGNETNSGPYLLSRSKLTFKKLFNELSRSKNKRPLLHLAWRQPVLFGRAKAPFYRLYAGENYKSHAEISQPVEEELNTASANDEQSGVDIFSQLERAMQAPVPAPSSIFLSEQQLETKATIEHIWQLDGLFKVYLQRIGRVPYLHIDSELQYQTPKQSDELTTQTEMKVAKFKQLRRVISKQIHYFDHPQFGMVVQIRRYKKPTENN